MQRIFIGPENITRKEWGMEQESLDMRGGKVTPDALALAERDGPDCNWCGTQQDLTIDHIVPLKKGGLDSLENKQLLCGGCNAQKGDRLAHECEKAVRFKSSLWQAGYTQVPNVVLLDADLSTNAKMVYIGLCFFAWQRDEVFPGQDTFAAKFGLSERSFRSARQELEAAGLLERRRRGKGRTNVYRLCDPKSARAANIAAQSPANPAVPDRQNLPESNKTKSVEKTQKTDTVSVDSDVQKVFDHYLAVFRPSRPPKLGSSQVRQIRKGLAEYDADALCEAIDGLFEWRKRKPGKTSLGAILDTYPGGKPLVEQIAFFISQAKGTTGGGGKFPSADRAIVSEHQRWVLRGHRRSDSEEAVQQAKESEAWLREHGIEVVHSDDPAVPPSFRPRRDDGSAPA